MLHGVSSTLHIIRVTWTNSPTQTDTVFTPDLSWLFVSCILVFPGDFFFLKIIFIFPSHENPILSCNTTMSKDSIACVGVDENRRICVRFRGAFFASPGF